MKIKKKLFSAVSELIGKEAARGFIIGVVAHLALNDLNKALQIFRDEFAVAKAQNLIAAAFLKGEVFSDDDCERRVCLKKISRQP